MSNISPFSFPFLAYSLECVQCESHENKDCHNLRMKNGTVAKNYTRPCDEFDDNVCMKVMAESTRTGWTGKNGMREIGMSICS